MSMPFMQIKTDMSGMYMDEPVIYPLRNIRDLYSTYFHGRATNYNSYDRDYILPPGFLSFVIVEIPMLTLQPYKYIV